ncbi:MAG: nucleotide sugar dehydrogenase [Methanobacterium sp.]
MKNLIEKINNRTACIGIIGLGYVGLPISMAFSKHFNTIGYDVYEKCITNLKSGKSHILDVTDTTLSKYLNNSFAPTNDPEQLKKCDFIIICVPTPLTEQLEPDLSYIKSASKTIASVLRKDQFIILESTTYPGTTEEVVLPILEATGLETIVDFGLAYSPERIDPGNKQYSVETTPKIVGGITDECTEVAFALYSTIIDKVIKVNDAKTAEAVKVVENIFRNVNIALVNELALVFEKMGIDTWEVIDAASSKPYGFMPFYPGPGIGGHCIPLDPFYMSYRAKKFGYIPRFIETSGEINDFMKIHAVNLIEKGLSKVNKKIYGSQIAVLGLAYKKNINDTRESPSEKIIEELVNLGAKVKVYDPFASSIKTSAGIFNSEARIEDVLSGSDCAIFVTDHDVFRSLNINESCKLMNSPVIVDCKNLNYSSDDIIYFGIGKCNGN